MDYINDWVLDKHKLDSQDFLFNMYQNINIKSDEFYAFLWVCLGLHLVQIYFMVHINIKY